MGARRIALNTFASYGRTIVGMCLGLFSIRWVLSALGPVDYGLAGVVGAVIVFITFFRGVLLVSTSRFYAFSIGEGDWTATRCWFNTALSVFCAMTALAALVGFPVGEWVVKHVLEIPENRMATAVVVFRISLVLACLTLLATPFLSMFTAKQDIVETSAWGLLETFSLFVFSYWILRCKGDVWLVYSIGTVLIHGAVLCAQVFRAWWRYRECRCRFADWFSGDRIRKLFSYVGFSVIGNAGILLRSNGISVLLNVWFPPSSHPEVNASFSVAGNVSNHSQSLSAALMNAFSPEITRMEGAGDRSGVVRYSTRASKFGSMFVLLFLVPLSVELDLVLRVWLKSPPAFALPMCWIMMAMFLVDKLTFGQLVSISAVGRIRGYQCTTGVAMVSTVLLAWVFLRCGGSPVSACWAMFATMALCSALRLLWARVLTGMNPGEWFFDVFLPIAATAALMGAGCLLLRVGFRDSAWVHFILVCSYAVVCWFFFGFWIVLTRDERDFCKRAMLRIRKRSDAGEKT